MNSKTIATLLLLLFLVATAPAAALPHNEETTTTPTEKEEKSSDENPVIKIELGQVVDAIEELTGEFDGFTDGLSTLLRDALIDVFFVPFRDLAESLIAFVPTVLMDTPSVYPNPAVEDVHGDVLLITYLVSTLGFAVAGILYIVGPVFGISYAQTRMVLPRMIAALVFAAVSLPLLQYMVEFSDALVTAFAPPNLQLTVTESLGLSTTLVLVWFIQAWLLLAFVLIFVVRDVYLLFIAAISPLLALAWAFPSTKRYADTFIAGWFTALAMAPLDVLVLKFNLALLNGDAGTPLQSMSNWVFGIASFVLLIWIPYQLYGASQAAIGQAYVISRGFKSTVQDHRKQRSRERTQRKLAELNPENTDASTDGGWEKYESRDYWKGDDE